MLLNEHPLCDLKLLLTQLRCLVVQSKIHVRSCKVGYAGQLIWLLLPQHSLPDLHHLLTQHRRFVIQSTIAIRRRKVVHAGQRGGMLFPSTVFLISITCSPGSTVTTHAPTSLVIGRFISEIIERLTVQWYSRSLWS